MFTPWTVLAYSVSLDNMTHTHQTATLVDELRTSPTVSVETAARVLGVSRAYGYTLARNGELPVIRVGRRVRVSSSALLRMLGEDA